MRMYSYINDILHVDGMRKVADSASPDYIHEGGHAGLKPTD